MGTSKSCQFKVWAFLKRNTALLSHDEYRAGHVGFHCGNTRRLNAIRGYTVNIHDENQALGQYLSASAPVTVKDEPLDFLTLWDGFPAVHFDDRKAWTEAGQVGPTRATENGLEVDADWTIADGPYLFDRVNSETTMFRSYHTRMHERVIAPVLRAENRPYKLVQFFRAVADPNDDFQQRVTKEYASRCSDMTGLNGLVLNFRDRDIDAAVAGYYPEGHWCFTDVGRAHRQAFFDLWDGALELYFDDLNAFLTARRKLSNISELQALEQSLFAAVWYVGVDENMIVMPNRQPAPSFYYR